MSSLEGIELSAGEGALGVIAFRGGDAARFLQGQLSADIEKLAPGAAVLAGLHNPQGRVIALLAVARASTDELLAVLPRELSPVVTTRLRKYVLRAKVRIEELPGMPVLGTSSGVSHEGVADIQWGDRRLLLLPEGCDFHPAPAESLGPWQAADVRQGIPQVYAATSETFIAQMLNLDLLGAIAFDKGCYTGQEVVARAHYRGRVKRRMQRWLNPGGVALQPGDAARTADGRALIVVRAAPADGAGQEILAVGNYSAAGESRAADASANASADRPADEDTAGAAVTVSGPLPLPYPLPD